MDSRWNFQVLDGWQVDRGHTSVVNDFVKGL